MFLSGNKQFNRRLRACLPGSAFGGLIEIIQPSFGRSADMHDWIADIAGVGLGIALALSYHRLRKHRA